MLQPNLIVSMIAELDELFDGLHIPSGVQSLTYKFPGKDNVHDVKKVFHQLNELVEAHKLVLNTLRHYRIDNTHRGDNVIANTCQYEGEVYYTPYYHEKALGGKYNDRDDSDPECIYYYFNLGWIDYLLFPELNGLSKLTVHDQTTVVHTTRHA